MKEGVEKLLVNGEKMVGGDGTEYLENTDRIRNEYIRNMGNSPSWQFLYTRTQ